MVSVPPIDWLTGNPDEPQPSTVAASSQVAAIPIMLNRDINIQNTFYGSDRNAAKGLK